MRDQAIRILDKEAAIREDRRRNVTWSPRFVTRSARFIYSTDAECDDADESRAMKIEADRADNGIM